MRITALFLLISSLFSSAAIEINGIAARVNGKVITKKEIAVLMQPRIALLQAQAKNGMPHSPKKTEEYLESVEKEILDELIDNKLVLTELESRQAQIPDHVVEQDMQRVIKDVYGGSEQKFRADLQKAGMTWTKYKEVQKEKILVQAFKGQQIGAVPPPTEAELEQERQKLRELPSGRDFAKDQVSYEKIYIMRLKTERDPDTFEPKPVPPEQQDALVKEVMTKLESGEAFSELAKTHSDDAYAQDGGQVPMTPRSDLSQDFAMMMFDSKVGELVGPIPDRAINKETEEVVVRGYTIFRVKSVELGPAKPMDEIRDHLSARVTKQKQRAQFERWLAPKRKTAIIRRSL